MYEIIAVALLINPQGNEQVRDSLTDIWESYKNNKQIIGIYRKLYMMFKRLILTFLDSFNSRISIDKMEKIRKLSTEFIDNYELINRNIDDKEKINDCTFKGCSKLVTSPPIHDGVTNMYYTFWECISLVNAPDIPNTVTDIYGCIVFLS